MNISAWILVIGIILLAAGIVAKITWKILVILGIIVISLGLLNYAFHWIV